MTEKDCLFCKIIRGEIPSDKVYENDLIYAFRDIAPAAPEHILIIPKKHIASLNDIETEDKMLFGEIMYRASVLAKELGFSEQGYRTVANTLDHGGQTVHHFHLHLIAGRQMTWPPG
ncbi:MAG: histidine triad nucleotide-binding protein [Candidatus Caenarcaniphilales bacterium]|nr:histidine triad nucleotide-binding protein [Candidatus Caenarcaniphilales bacterium]